MKMAVIFKYKHIFLYTILLITDARSRIAKDDPLSFQIQSQKVSNARDDIGLNWPMGIVTYYLDNLAYDSFVAHKVRLAMNSLESASCVRFKPILIKPTGNITWIHFTNPQGERKCVHEPEYKKGGEIVVVFGFDCLKEREIMHCLLHALGFKDEVSHPYRDQFIRVLWNNIQPEYRYLYRIQTNEEVSSKLLVEYDPMSVMHFHDRAFSSNGQATVMPLVSGLLISPSENLSQLDKMKLRLLFDHECNKRKVVDMVDTCRTIMVNKTKLKDEVSFVDKGNYCNQTESIKNKTVTENDLNAEDEEKEQDKETISDDDSKNAVEDKSDVNKDDLNVEDKNKQPYKETPKDDDDTENAEEVESVNSNDLNIENENKETLKEEEDSAETEEVESD